jgi:hypothetical protein
MNSGLCATCVHARIMTSDRGSTFLRCTHPDLPKYPRLPVITCHGWKTLAPPPSTPIR